MSSPIRIVVQARLTSSRLPGKALLPVRGVPSAALAALRVTRGNFDTVVATSTDASDDVLASTLEGAGLHVMRGPIDDVLGRFVAATSDLPDDAIIVRLTGDNVFPDADFVSLIVANFQTSDVGLVGASSPDDGLPYGLFAEAFRLETLRIAAGAEPTDFEREHVTPWIKRNFVTRIFDRLSDEVSLGHLRCTIDTLDDYLRVCRVFETVADPVAVGWRDLCTRLAALDDAPKGLVPGRLVGESRHGQLVLGTAQLAMPYGVANQSGPPAAPHAVAIVRTAIEHGVTHIDTARAYGESETRIGAALRDGWHTRAQVVTKLDPLDELPMNVSGESVRDAVDASVSRSCRELGLRRLATVLLHRAGQRPGPVWDRLRELKDGGVIEKLGVSAQTPEEAADAAGDSNVSHIQLPHNLLDRRWDEAGLPDLAAVRPELIIHARSALLQGILATGAEDVWPCIPGVHPDVVMRALDALANDLGRDGPDDLCLAYVRGQPWIHGVVVGVETLDQLRRNIDLFRRPALTTGEIELVRDRLPLVPDILVNPAKWPSASREARG